MSSIQNALTNLSYKALGAGFLVLAKIQNQLEGYRHPRPYGTSEIERTVIYCNRVIDEWMDAYSQYTGQQTPPLAGKRILELGPGPEFCNAMILLSRGVRSYAAVDAFPLALSAPPELYARLFDSLKLDENSRADLLSELKKTLDRGECNQLRDLDSRIRYAVRRDFDLTRAFPDDRFDLFLSNAAFEHFDDVEKTLRQMTELSQPGSQMVISIDFTTHSRWIRDKDPLNIYRYGDRFYNAVAFQGSPNRVSLPRYVELIEALGWQDIRTYHVGGVPAEQFARIRDSLAPRFRNDATNHVWATVCASRA